MQLALSISECQVGPVRQGPHLREHTLVVRRGH